MEVNIWNMTIEQTKALRFGTRVTTGINGDRGTLIGVRSTGIVVVAWDHTEGSKDPKNRARLVEYALS